jgi:uncharacterized membrane protein
MKVHTASLITGILFIIAGALLWWKYDATTKWFSLASSFIVTGLAIVLVSLLAKIKR